MVADLVIAVWDIVEIFSEISGVFSLRNQSVKQKTLKKSQFALQETYLRCYNDFMSFIFVLYLRAFLHNTILMRFGCSFTQQQKD